jgi:CRP-like cAMP-binding protein
MGYLFKLLPATLKIQLSKFLNRDAIALVPFLQNRPDTFYLNYLEKLKPMRFDKGDVVFEKGQKSQEIFINIGGDLLDLETNRVYQTGSIAGVDDIIFNRERQSTFVAETELFTIRLERDLFEKMMKEFPDIK